MVCVWRAGEAARRMTPARTHARAAPLAGRNGLDMTVRSRVGGGRRGETCRSVRLVQPNILPGSTHVVRNRRQMTGPTTRLAHEQRRSYPGAGGEKRRLNMANAWQETRELIWRHRRQVALGFLLMIINRLSALVLPASSKVLIDRVIGQHQARLLVPLAVAIATLIQAGTTFALSQVMSVAAQRAIADMRKAVNLHVQRLPVSYFDRTQSGILISRIMNDADGIRNLVGTGLVQLSGGVVTAILALGVLFWLNWQLTSITLLILITFAVGMALAFTRLRPIFRERSVITADVTGRLAQSLGGIRVVKTYVAERREQIVFARGVHKLFRNIARSITGVSAITSFTTV